jgi:Spy/CpxP family protein refolding chaperone
MTMKRILVSLGLVVVSAAAAMAQMSGGSAGQAQQGMMGGMMGQGQTGMTGGMMPCMMMGQSQGQGMMMGGPMMMGEMMAGMMPAKAKGCLGMAGMMMTGCLDMPRVQSSLGLTAEQVDKLRAVQRPLQKEAIRIGADIRVAELDVADLLSADTVDFDKVEGRLREAETLRTKLTLAHLGSAEEVKKIIPREQLEKFQGMCQNLQRPAGAVSPAPAPQASPGGGREQEHHPAQ